MDNFRFLLSLLLLFVWTVFNVEVVLGADFQLNMVGRAFVAWTPIVLLLLPTVNFSWKIVYACFAGFYALLTVGSMLLLKPEVEIALIQVAMEFALLSILFFLSFRLVLSLNSRQQTAVDFSEVLHNNRLKTFIAAREDINNELDRSRRYEYPVCFLSLRIEENSFREVASALSRDISREITENYLRKKIGQQLSQMTRISDILVEQQGNKGFYLVCPQTSEENVEQFIHKINDSLFREMGLTVTFGAASFPNDSVDMDELLRTAQEKSRSLEEPSFERAGVKDDRVEAESAWLE